MSLLFVAFVTSLLLLSLPESVTKRSILILGPFSFDKIDQIKPVNFSPISEENGKDHINAFTARNYFHSRAIWIFICVVIQVFGHINVTNVTNHLPEETLFCVTLKYMKIKMTIEVLIMTKTLIFVDCILLDFDF